MCREMYVVPGLPQHGKKQENSGGKTGEYWTNSLQGKIKDKSLGISEKIREFEKNLPTADKLG